MFGEATPPAGTFTAVAAGDQRTCGLLADGTVQCWGQWNNGDTLAPTTGGFTQLAMGELHACGLKSDGSVSCWGNNTAGQLDVPSTATGFTEITAAWDYTWGLHADGSVECWGEGSAQPAPTTTDTFVHIAAARTMLCGLHADQTVACIAASSIYTQLAVPPDGQVAWLAAGGTLGCGVRADGIGRRADGAFARMTTHEPIQSLMPVRLRPQRALARRPWPVHRRLPWHAPVVPPATERQPRHALASIHACTGGASCN
jgi:hypothetical protein